MTAIKHPMLLWGLPVAALIIIFWLSLFCTRPFLFPEQMQPAPCCLDTRQRYQKRWCKTFVCHEAWSPF